MQNMVSRPRPDGILYRFETYVRRFLMEKKEFNYFDKPENIKRLKIISYIALALTVVIDFFVVRKYVHFSWENVPGFYALFGFIACVLIIVLAKFLGHKWLMKREDYYD